MDCTDNIPNITRADSDQRFVTNYNVLPWYFTEMFLIPEMLSYHKKCIWIA